MISENLKNKFNAVYPEGCINETTNNFGLKCYLVRFTKFSKVITFHINNETDLIKRLDLDKMQAQQISYKHHEFSRTSENSKQRYQLIVLSLDGVRRIIRYGKRESAIKSAQFENKLSDNFSVHLYDRFTGEEIKIDGE